MSDSDNKIEDLASKYLNLWQEQLKSQASDKVVSDAMAAANQMNAGVQELMKSLDTPEKTQEWMATWAQTWKAQFDNGTEQQNPFAQAFQNGATSHKPAPEHTEHDVDELTLRITLLEERLQQLESKLKG